MNVVIKDVLNENYLIDGNVAGKVTIATAKPILKEGLISSSGGYP